MKSSLRLGLTLAVGVLAMSSAALFIRFAQADGVPSIVIAAYRLSIATLVLSIPAIHQRAWLEYAKLDSKEAGLLAVCGVMLGLHFATWVTSLAFTSVASSVVLVTTTPLWIGLFSPLILGESTSRLTWVGLFSAIVGGSIIGLAGGSGSNQITMLGNGLALSGAFLLAGYLMIGRSVRQKLRLVAYLWLVYGIAALVLIVWAVAGRLPLGGYHGSTLIWLISLGLIPQLIGHSAANYAVRHLSATFVGVATLGEPVGSTILALIFLEETLVLAQIIGGALILCGIGLASIREGRWNVRQRRENV